MKKALRLVLIVVGVIVVVGFLTLKYLGPQYGQ